MTDQNHRHRNSSLKNAFQKNHITVSMAQRIEQVPVAAQSMKELLEANEGYLNWLDSIGAEEAKQEFIQGLERSLARTTGVYYYQPPTGVYEYVPPVPSLPGPLVTVSDVSFSPYTHKSKNAGSAEDPLNLMFTGNGDPNRIAEILIHEFFPPWLSTEIPEAPSWPPVIRNCCSTQYVYVDTKPDWQPMNHTLAIGGCALHRCHIRLFDGGYSKQLSHFTLAGVHYEQSSLSRLHAIQDWDRSQAFIRGLFESKSFCGKVREVRFQPDGEQLQGIAHDGLASVIELL